MVIALEEFRLRKVDGLGMHGGERREGWYSHPADVDGPFMGLRAEPQEKPENRGTGKGTPVPDYRADRWVERGTCGCRMRCSSLSRTPGRSVGDFRVIINGFSLLEHQHHDVSERRLKPESNPLSIIRIAPTDGINALTCRFQSASCEGARPRDSDGLRPR